MQRYAAGVLQAVRGAERDVGGLVFRQQFLDAVARHTGGAGHHDPVFGTVMVHLQRKLLARFDHDAFDLEALADVDALVPAPGPEYAGMELVLAAAAGLQVIDHFLHVLGAALVRHQHRVCGFHNQQIGNADGGHHA